MFTKEKFMSFYKGTPSEAAASQCYDALLPALMNIGIFTDLTLAGALATVRTEVGKSFLPIKEVSDGSQYEGRKDLGNVIAGDGPKYKGRGFIQITGRYNYENYAHKLGIDIICNPDLALDMGVATKILGMYFKDRGVNLACNNQDWTKARKLVNGGTNGLDTFLSVINQYLS